MLYNSYKNKDKPIIKINDVNDLFIFKPNIKLINFNSKKMYNINKYQINLINAN